MVGTGHISSTLDRRGLLSGGGGHIRPPWTDEARVRRNCSSCGDCIRACPEAILTGGPAGTPVVDFARGACTFCGDCATACGEDVFDDLAAQPWTLVARIGAGCLLRAGISCRSCTDACDRAALRFDIGKGAVGAIGVLADACSGCGACAGLCPVDAIAFAPRPEAMKMKERAG